MMVETEVGDVVCSCGCGHTWLVSRGSIDGTRFVAIPAHHDDLAQRCAWLAIELDDRWAAVKTWQQDGNIAAGVLDGSASEVWRVEPFASSPALLASRAYAIEDSARKTRLFALHDALVAQHDDVAALFAPASDRDFSYGMPDCVFATPPAQRTGKRHQNFAEHTGRRFVRALLPIRVADDGTELRIGVWVEIADADFRRLVAVFWDDEPAYLATVVAGAVETSCVVRGDDLRGTPVTLAARTADQCLFVRGSDDVRVARLVRDGVFARQVPGLMHRLQRLSRLGSR